MRSLSRWHRGMREEFVLSEFNDVFDVDYNILSTRRLRTKGDDSFKRLGITSIRRYNVED